LSTKTVSAVEQLCRYDDVFKATADQWDGDPWLLNTPGGIVDLRTGTLRTARREDYCTKRTSVSPAEGEPALFMAFLRQIMGGDETVVSYLNRLFGYCLTGSTMEHVFAFFYGSGANGKGTLTGIIGDILNDYAQTAALETFIATNTPHHPTDVAGLRGSRLVVVPETEGGRHWAEAKLKTLTGGDRISARLMRQDFFEFTPQFKITISGNHKPNLRTVGEAIRRRLHLVPFEVTIPEGQRDPRLREKLKAEAPQILAWMIRGCLEYQRLGLCPPAKVREATEAYFEDQDSFASWIGDKCETGKGFLSFPNELYISWKSHAESAGEFPGTMKDFVSKLEARGFVRDRSHGKRFIVGIRPREGQANEGNRRWDD
jgi:putative DNA primase/helicase